VNQGTLYICLVRLLQRKWLSATWGTSENNRRARFYTLTAAGRRHLQAETANWERVSGVMSRMLQLQKVQG
jgi:DNA-binding PadR family transcriptional regulator